MKKNIVIAILSIVLLVLVLLTIVFGCSFKLENFENLETDAEEAPAPAKKAAPKPGKDAEKTPTPLTPKEKEMFENIKKGSLTDEEIQKYIADGKLTEKMVEKFLEHIEAPELPAMGGKKPATPAAKPAPKKAAVAAEAEEGFMVEGFEGSTYASF